jgi:hypothetical protein
VTTGSVSRIDDQILAIWRALLVNPSLDARWAMQVIDRLLDERPRPGQALPPGTLTLRPHRSLVLVAITTKTSERS